MDLETVFGFGSIFKLKVRTIQKIIGKNDESAVFSGRAVQPERGIRGVLAALSRLRDKFDRDYHRGPLNNATFTQQGDKSVLLGERHVATLR